MNTPYRFRRPIAILPTLAFIIVMILILPSLFLPISARAGDKEYFGKLETKLLPNFDEFEEIIFRPITDFSKLKFTTPLERDVNVTAGRLYHPPQDKSSILTLLVEPEDGEPYIYADVDSDKTFADSERFEFKREDEDDPIELNATIQLPMQGTLFPTYPIVARFYKDVDWSHLKEGERLIQQSKIAFARGSVEIDGRKTIVQYVYTGQSKKISPSNGWLGVDSDGDGEVLIDRFSPEAAFAREETVVFRVGQIYVSTKRVDLEKNEIVLRSHEASDYKRMELRVGSEVPDFTFTDFNGKKRKFSEFRGKYVLVDFWGTWCPACIDELPYLKTAYSRFQPRGLEILGMNEDRDVSAVKSWLKSNGLAWTQATTESIVDVKRALRIFLYPSTFLVGPDGKVISLNQKNQPDLRGRDLLKSLDELLPP
jgi:peroxiredoxin